MLKKKVAAPEEVAASTGKIELKTPLALDKDNSSLDKNLSEHWLLQAVELPPLSEKIVRGEMVFQEIIIGKNDFKELTEETNADFLAYAEYAFGRVVIPNVLRLDSDVRCLMGRMSRDEYQTTYASLIKERNRDDFDQALYNGKLDAFKNATKEPRDRAWQKKLYRGDDEELGAWLRNHTSYGVRAGPGKDYAIIIFDFDDLKRCLGLEILKDLAPSLVVAARSNAAHVYYRMIMDDYKRLLALKEELGVKGKLIFADPDAPGHQLGEVKFQDSYTIGPNSHHWTGRRYTVTYDRAGLSIISADVVIELLRRCKRAEAKADPIKAAKNEAVSETCAACTSQEDDKPEKCNWLDDVDILAIIAPDPIYSDDRENSGWIKGTHPVHGSDSGQNFSVNVKGQRAYCFRHQVGYNKLIAFAVKSGLLNCEDVRTGCLKGRGAELREKLVEHGYLVPDNTCIKEYHSLEEQVALVLEHLTWENQLSPELFVYNGELARVMPDGKIKAHDKNSLPLVIDRAIKFMKVKGRGENRELVNDYPPYELVGAMLTHGSWPGLPVLRGVTKAPIVRRDFSICTEPGYDPESGMFYRGETILLPEPPLLGKVDSAVAYQSQAIEAAMILDKALFDGFIFTEDPSDIVDPEDSSKTVPNQASAANAWVMLLMTLLRPVFDLAPGIAISKPDVSSGASVLSDLPALILYGTTGWPCAVLPNKKEGTDAGDEEQFKRVDTALIMGCLYVVLDNRHSVEADYFTSFLTERIITLRVFRTNNKAVERENNYIMVVNGKQLLFSDDTLRRFIWVELEANKHLKFKYDIKKKIIEYRQEILRLLLLIVRGWVQSGRPMPETGKAGSQLVSFRDAVDTVDAILQFAGIDDAFTNLEKQRAETNPEREAWDNCFYQWYCTLGDGAFTSDELRHELKRIERHLPAKLLTALLKGDASAISSILREHKDREYSNLVLKYDNSNHRRRVWRVEPIKIELVETTSTSGQMGQIAGT